MRRELEAERAHAALYRGSTHGCFYGCFFGIGLYLFFYFINMVIEAQGDFLFFIFIFQMSHGRLFFSRAKCEKVGATRG